MFELFHTVLTSLLLSASVGFGAGASTEPEQEPADSESGVDVGALPAYLILPRGEAPAPSEQRDNHQPAAPGFASVCGEPAVVVVQPIASRQSHATAARFLTAGRSP